MRTPVPVAAVKVVAWLLYPVLFALAYLTRRTHERRS
jgi:hypothetical protein